MSKNSVLLTDPSTYVRDILISLIDKDEMGRLLKQWATSGSKLPDVDAMMATHKRNLETLTAANQAIADGIEKLAQRQTAIMCDYMNSLSAAIQDVVNADSAETSAQLQAEFARKTMESVVQNMREFAEMTSRSGNTVFELMNREVKQNLGQLRTTAGSEVGAEAYRDLQRAVRETQAAAQRAGITQDDVDRELAVRKAERLSSRR